MEGNVGLRPPGWVMVKRRRKLSLSLLGTRPSHKSNVFLYLEFDPAQTYRDYDLASPWIVHCCWEDDWVDDVLGRRILIYRNTKAHENPDHELWRLAEYEDEVAKQKQNLPASSRSPNGSN